MESLFPEVDENHAAFIHEFCKKAAKRLVPERTLLELFEEAERLEAWMLDPQKIQKEYVEFMGNMATLHHLLIALNAQDTVVRFNSSHSFAIGLGEARQKFEREEKK